MWGIPNQGKTQLVYMSREATLMKLLCFLYLGNMYIWIRLERGCREASLDGGSSILHFYSNIFPYNL